NLSVDQLTLILSGFGVNIYDADSTRPCLDKRCWDNMLSLVPIMTAGPNRYYMKIGANSIFGMHILRMLNMWMFAKHGNCLDPYLILSG
ncbi:MAG: hypothetical protein JXX29_03165, partial [Deltaproteobacteria bacterium]|nr:hypothetical protein [Deltaproteobacteria bacterium]MBN2670641.1 hypothetical protein [Deltaproteobacteria bacterium]